MSRFTMMGVRNGFTLNAIIKAVAVLGAEGPLFQNFC